jgi:hypothetical protein
MIMLHTVYEHYPFVFNSLSIIEIVRGAMHLDVCMHRLFV